MTDHSYLHGRVARERLAKRALRAGAVTALLALASTSSWLWRSGLGGVAFQLLDQRRAEETEGSIWLPAYSAAVQGVQVSGLRDNLSGLTFNFETGTLFGVVNRPAEIVELSRSGALLRRIPLKGIDDPEGIAHIEGTRFALAEEARQRVVLFDLPVGATKLDLSGTAGTVLNLGLFGNMGIEGLHWDAANRRLLVTQEMLPVRVLEITGLEQAAAGEALAVDIREWKPGHSFGHAAGDLSSITQDERTGNLLLLSEMSGTLSEYRRDGTPVSVMPLWKGWHGLAETIPQAEGVAVGPEGEIYLTSEPNLFYRFDRGPRQTQVAARED